MPTSIYKVILLIVTVIGFIYSMWFRPTRTRQGPWGERIVIPSKLGTISVTRLQTLKNLLKAELLENASQDPDEESRQKPFARLDHIREAFHKIDPDSFDQGKITDGEITPESFSFLLRSVQTGPRDVFYDLGSGTGLVVLQAALEFGVKRAVGFELNPQRHLLGCAALSVCPHQALAGKRDPGEVVLRHGTFFSFTFEDATVIYVSSLVFPKVSCLNPL